MPNLTSLEAFVLAAKTGSFSAAARRMRKAQSAVSTAIANLEIDSGVDLFDRAGRNPVLTEHGRALLPYARNVLYGSQEFIAKANTLSEGVEAELCLAVEQSIGMAPLLPLLGEFAERFPHVALDLLRPGPNDTAALLSGGRADIGLMIEQEVYPIGFQFRGVGHSKLVPVCAPGHPLASLDTVGHGDLRRHRQLITHSRSRTRPAQIGDRKSAAIWQAESPALIADLVIAGFGWAELPNSLVAAHLESGALVVMSYLFQQSDLLEGIDVVWTERHALGPAGQWLRDSLLAMPQTAWRDG